LKPSHAEHPHSRDEAAKKPRYYVIVLTNRRTIKILLGYLLPDHLVDNAKKRCLSLVFREVQPNTRIEKYLEHEPHSKLKV